MNGVRWTVSLVEAVFVVLAGVVGTPSTAHSTPKPSDQIGVLVIAHGGNHQWDGMVRRAVKDAKLGYPTEVALGMGMHGQEIRQLQQAVDRLQRTGIGRLVVVPLLVSSHSEVFRQYEYLFRLRTTAEWPEAGTPLQLAVPVVMGHALDDDPAVVDVLVERAKALSRVPEQETVILVAHGPNGDEDNAKWLADMQTLSAMLKQQAHFRQVLTFTIRDDAPKALHDRATEALREAVAAHSQTGQVLVVPLLMARGGIERKIPKLLGGLRYVYTGDTLLPHPKVARWIAQEAAALIGESASRPLDEQAASPSTTNPRGVSSEASMAVIQ